MSGIWWNCQLLIAPISVVVVTSSSWEWALVAVFLLGPASQTQATTLLCIVSVRRPVFSPDHPASQTGVWVGTEKRSYCVHIPFFFSLFFLPLLLFMISLNSQLHSEACGLLSLRPQTSPELSILCVSSPLDDCQALSLEGLSSLLLMSCPTIFITTHLHANTQSLSLKGVIAQHTRKPLTWDRYSRNYVLSFNV